ncbi:MAG: DUF116 domain-containing protein [Bacteroidota bacterium]
MKPFGGITYSLDENGTDSSGYYTAITSFGEYLIPKMEKALGLITDGMAGYIEKSKPEKSCSREIYLFEALMLGTFWNIYGGFAAGTSRYPVSLMKHSALIRSKGGFSRRWADLIRAGLAFRLLEKKSNAGLFLFPCIAGLEKLIQWMDATGEFNREAGRFRKWLDFFRQENEAFTFVNLSKIRIFALEFSHESEKHLGKFTRNVDQFIAVTSIRRYFREDKISVSRRKAEYHLNMLGAFIYNRALRSDFLKSTQKIVLLPACMKANPRGTCRAIQGCLGEICSGCTNHCLINRIHHLGKKSHFNVVIVKHSSDISLSKHEIPDGCGLIGVACVPAVIAGGLELLDKSVPAQCVLLDHSGCRHWSSQTIPTSLNLSELLERAGQNHE